MINVRLLVDINGPKAWSQEAIEKTTREAGRVLSLSVPRLDKRAHETVCKLQIIGSIADGLFPMEAGELLQMKFVHITDTHLVDEGRLLNGGVPTARLDACLDDISRWHPDAEFCVISGDLAEFSEVEAYQALKVRLAVYPLPCFLLIGNHDDRAVFQSVFPDHPKDMNEFVQHRFETEQGVFLFLDTSKNGRDVHEGQLCSYRLDWLKQQLTEAGDKPTYLFLHHPPFEIGIPYVDDIRLVEAEAFAEALQHGRDIRHVFYGHVHRMTYVNWRGIPFTSLPSLNHQIPLNAASVDAEFCDEPPAYGVVRIEDDQLTVHFNTFLHRNPLHQT